MKLPWLTPVLEATGPVVSVHLDTTRTDPQAAGELEARWARMRSTLTADGAPRALLAQIEETVLSPSTLGGRHGRTVIATDDAILVDRDQLGGMADEKITSPGYVGYDGLEVKSIRKDERDMYTVQARRITVPVVLEPNAGIRITGTGV